MQRLKRTRQILTSAPGPRRGESRSEMSGGMTRARKGHCLHLFAESVPCLDVVDHNTDALILSKIHACRVLGIRRCHCSEVKTLCLLLLG